MISHEGTGVKYKLLFDVEVSGYYASWDHLEKDALIFFVQNL